MGWGGEEEGTATHPKYGKGVRWTSVQAGEGWRDGAIRIGGEDEHTRGELEGEGAGEEGDEMLGGQSMFISRSKLLREEEV